MVTIGADVNGDAGLTQAGLLSVNVNEKVGEAKHTLSVTEIPSHYHYVHMSAGGSMPSINSWVCHSCIVSCYSYNVSMVIQEYLFFLMGILVLESKV